MQCISWIHEILSLWTYTYTLSHPIILCTPLLLSFPNAPTFFHNTRCPLVQTGIFPSKIGWKRFCILIMHIFSDMNSKVIPLLCMKGSIMIAKNLEIHHLIIIVFEINFGLRSKEQRIDLVLSYLQKKHQHLLKISRYVD